MTIANLIFKIANLLLILIKKQFYASTLVKIMLNQVTKNAGRFSQRE